jgi:hypothetical protein
VANQWENLTIAIVLMVIYVAVNQIAIVNILTMKETHEKNAQCEPKKTIGAAMNKDLQKFAEEFWDDIPKEKNQIDALASVYDKINKCLKAGRFDIVDAILIVGLPYVNFSTTIKLAMLTTTLAAKDKLKNRKDYYEMCKLHFKSREETKKRVDQLLVGLE